MNLTKLNPITFAEKLTGRTLASSTRHYFKDSILYTAASVIPKLMSFIMMPVVTAKLSNTGEYNTFGVFSTATVMFLCTTLSLQAESSVARYYYEGKDDFPDFLGSLFIFTTAFAAVMGLQFWYFRDFWAWTLLDLHGRIGVTIFLWALGCSMAQILHQVYMQLLMVRKRSLAYFGWSFARNALYVGFGIYFLITLSSGKIMGLVWAYAISTLVLAIPFLVAIVRWMRPVFHWRHVRYALFFSLPALPGVMAGALITFFDRIYFQHKNPDLGGPYNYAYQFAWIIQMVTTGLFSAYMPRFYEHMNKGESEANQKIFARNLKLLLLGAVALTLVSQPMATLLSSKSGYLVALPVIPIVISAYLFAYLWQCYGLYVAFRRKFIFLQSLNLILTAVLNIVLNVWIWRHCPNPALLDSKHIFEVLQDPAVRAQALTLYRMIALATLVPYFIQWLICWLIARVLLKEKTVSFKGARLALLAYLAFSAFWSFFGYTLFSR